MRERHAPLDRNPYRPWLPRRSFWRTRARAGTEAVAEAVVSMRRLAYLVTLLLALTQASHALAHASLIRAEPADGAVLAQPPPTLRLTFNEPVSPLIIRLIAPSGELISPAVAAEN